MWAGPTAVGYKRWSFSNALWMKCYDGDGKYKPKVSEYLQMYRCQLDFEMFCATIALGIS